MRSWQPVASEGHGQRAPAGTPRLARGDEVQRRAPRPRGRRPRAGAPRPELRKGSSLSATAAAARRAGAPTAPVTGRGAAPGSQTYEGMEAVATLGPAPPRQPLRRPFASILAEINLPPRRAMYLIGHTDPTLTMRVYQQVIDMGDGGLEAREKLVGCTLEEAFALLSGRGVLSTNCSPAGKWPPSPSRGVGRKALKPLAGGDFSEAAEGTRTLDLLHGKQTL